MPTYTQDHEVYDFHSRKDRHLKITVTCPASVIEHLDTEILANLAIDMPERGFTIVFKVDEPEIAMVKPKSRKPRKR